MTLKSILFIATGIVLMILVAAKIPGKDNLDANATSIQFESGSWNEVLALAKKENKPIFLDISTSWCGYCKRMKANVFTDAKVAKFYNSTFINISVDGQKGEGIELAKKFEVRGYPTFVFLNPEGSLAYQTSGYRNPQKFLALGKKAYRK